MRISAILLAAGLSQRMDEDKLLLEYQGRSLLQHSIDLLSELPVFERFIVTTEVRVANMTIPAEVRLIINNSPAIGQSESIRLGVTEAKGTHYLFLVADQPKLTSADLMPIINAEKCDSIVFPVVDSEPRSPTMFPSSFRFELLSLSDDSGGRVVRDAHPEVCHAIVPERPENFVDIDNMEDYKKLRVES